MKVLLVNTYDSGGAANSCVRLHCGLLNSGIESHLIVKHKSRSDIKSITKFHPIYHHSFISKLEAKSLQILKGLKLTENTVNGRSLTSEQTNFLNARAQGLEYFSFIDTPFDITESIPYQEADIIHLNWVADFLDWKTFFKKNTKPVVWTLHDEAPFLGGEHYAERFFGIDSNGAPKKRTYTNVELEFQRKTLNRKKKLLQNVSNLTIACPSRWLLMQSQKSKLFFGLPHFYIPYGLPADIFGLRNKGFCREVFNIPDNKIVLLFVADSLNKKRKGLEYLKRAIDKLPTSVMSQIFLFSVGSGEATFERVLNGLHFGRIADEHLMALAYSAADAFIIPSLEDNLPNTMLEALMCGTPLIGFPVGGIADVIEDGINGYLCDEVNVEALVQTLNKFFNNHNQFDRSEIREQAVRKYDQSIQANAYRSLYSKVLEERSNDSIINIK